MHGIALNPALSGHEVREVIDHSGAVADRRARGLPPTAVGELLDAGSTQLQVSVGGDVDGLEPVAELVAG